VNTERIIDRVRKMLALAHDSGASEGERDNALRMAHATLAKYNLDLAQVEQAKGTKKVVDGQEPRGPIPCTFYGRPWARLICEDVGRMLFCEYLWITATKAKDTRHFFIGRYSNAVTAGILSEFLVNGIMREGKRRARANGAGNAWFRSFALGAAAAIRTRVDALLREATTAPGSPVAAPPANARSASHAAAGSAPGTTVALASVYATEHAANRAVVEAFAPDRKTRGYTGKTDTLADAVSAGHDYGRTVSLNRQVR
jgi:hypothetical protein